jgi:glycine betaine/proline transport system permease protein
MSQENNPWGNAPQNTQQEASPWGGGAAESAPSPDWLAKPEEIEVDFDWLDPFKEALIPLELWVESALDWTVNNFRDFFQSIRAPIDLTLSGIEDALLSLNPWIIVLFFVLAAWQISNYKLALGTFLSLLFIGFTGAWDAAMTTLSLVITSVLFCIAMGLPTGIWISKSDRASMVIKPILDAMQTTPAFVYLIPIVMLFGIGIRQVPQDLIEASRSFGASPWQMLWRVQLPVALPTIMAGINQTLMLALSMVVIASMIAVGGLGQMVLRGIGRLDMGLAALGGISIVLLAIILDRLTQALGKKQSKPGQWYTRGPIGLIVNLIQRRK